MVVRLPDRLVGVAWIVAVVGLVRQGGSAHHAHRVTCVRNLWEHSETRSTPWDVTSFRVGTMSTVSG